MYWTDWAELITVSKTDTPTGGFTEGFERTGVFANVKSISQSEVYQAAALGFKPELKVEIRLDEYNGQTKLKCGNIVYDILRTFTPENADKIELICSRPIAKPITEGEDN